MDIFEKYGVVFDGKRRRYVYPLPEKLNNLENTIPEYLKIGDYKIESTSWGDLILKTSKYLLSLREEYRNGIYDFSASWSDVKYFTNEKKCNYEMIDNTLFVSINHTSIHSCWFIIELLCYFEIDFSLCELVIKRYHKAEPREIRDFIRDEFKKNFSIYLMRHELLSEEKVKIAIDNIDKLNALFSKRNSANDDLYLFDDALLYAGAKSSFLAELPNKISNYYKIEKPIKKYLGYLTDYYRDAGYYYKSE